MKEKMNENYSGTEEWQITKIKKKKKNKRQQEIESDNKIAIRWSTIE